MCICIKCGRRMEWNGHIWLCCEHCGQLQMWQTEEEKERDRKVLNADT